MIEFLTSPWLSTFESMVHATRSSLVISSPYVGRQPCEILREAAGTRALKLDLMIVTDLSRDVLLRGATDVEALCDVANSFPHAEVRFLPSLHAKVYVADERCAVVTSANMTASGLCHNFEYGVKIADKRLVSQIHRDVVEYAQLGTPIESTKLRFLADLAKELNGARRRAERTIQKRLRSEFDRRLGEFSDEILRARAAGRTPHAIFADAILYLLRRGPMPTAELHPLIRGIHPDLCDEAVDRVIEGKHFGKKWKHAVRTAQQHLKRRELIELRNGKWRLTKG
ncbi:MAG: hypothetical protein AMK73_09625 [Planctomycetes bacterium SM23_32]|nr:MAG: hypothetical protein AMK73_09625 [Planctomycetes bacterium SM23_32]